MPYRAVRHAVGLAAVAALAGAVGGCLEPETALLASFTLAPSEGTSPLTIHVDASGSYAEDGAIAAYGWDFGDGDVATGVTAEHTYTTDSEHAFSVTLTVTDHKERQAQATEVVTVFPPEPPPPDHTVGFVWPFHFDAIAEDAANLNDEYFTLENAGSEAVDMTGWSVSNEHGDTFQFPDGFALAPGAVVTIHSGAGADTKEILHWNASEPVWNNTSDIGVLYDDISDIVDVYAYGSC
ncbi:MAG: lamin tail domain-containing protein [Candidatus Bipolaricaulis sp.]|nr:lamin tail domain-containing protein [Candidatus Bipolaricaulis sp.]